MFTFFHFLFAAARWWNSNEPSVALFAQKIISIMDFTCASFVHRITFTFDEISSPDVDEWRASLDGTLICSWKFQLWSDKNLQGKNIYPRNFINDNHRESWIHFLFLLTIDTMNIAINDAHTRQLVLTCNRFRFRVVLPTMKDIFLSFFSLLFHSKIILLSVHVIHHPIRCFNSTREEKN